MPLALGQITKQSGFSPYGLNISVLADAGCVPCYRVIGIEAVNTKMVFARRIEVRCIGTEMYIVRYFLFI